MYTNLEKLAALRYCYDLGGCVTVKIASIQGSKRLTFCSATNVPPSAAKRSGVPKTTNETARIEDIFVTCRYIVDLQQESS
jgi:hypothetical protein